MSTKKRSSAETLQELHAAILERLSKVKPLLDNQQHQNWPLVTQELVQITSLIPLIKKESIFGTYPASSTKLRMRKDSPIKQPVRSFYPVFRRNLNIRVFETLVRLAAFRLVEAGLENKPGIETLIHILQLASKTGTILCEIGNNAIAASVLTSAAKFEERLRNADDPGNSHQRATACAIVMYHSSRMEAAWKEGNHTVADYMSRKITGELRFAPALLNQANSREGSKPAEAVQWLQRAFSIADQLDTTAPAVSELKISILRTMARAYFLSEAYDRAETVLDELIPTIDASNDRASSEYQELRWLRLAVLKRRKAGDAALIDGQVLTAFKSIVDHMEFSEATVTDVLQDLRTLSHHHNLVTVVHQHCLEQALRRHTTELDHIQRLILSLIIHSSKDDNHANAIKALETTFTAVCDSDVELPSIPTTACLTLIWQYGGRHYKSKKWSEAADWYLAGSHNLFKTKSPSSSAKCFRKAALCYIEQRDYALASTAIRRCPTNEAPTHYLSFLTAMNQGLEDEAIRAIHDMVKAPDFDRKMLLLATQISHQSEMKGVLLAVLENLLKTLKIGSNAEVVEAITLNRCIIKLILSLLVEPAANRPVLVDTVVNKFRTARILTEAASTQKMVTLVFKDISWLWRTAYNCAVQGCTEWENAGEQISELFDIARELLEACCHASPVDIDADSCLHLANASFASVSGRVFSARELMATTGAIDDDRLSSISADIKTAKGRIKEICEKKIVQASGDNERIQYFLHALRVYQAEFFSLVLLFGPFSLAVYWRRLLVERQLHQDQVVIGLWPWVDGRRSGGKNNNRLPLPLLMRNLRFNSLSLPFVANILLSVHHQRPQYNLVRANCFWYADAVFQILRAAPDGPQYHQWPYVVFRGLPIIPRVLILHVIAGRFQNQMKDTPLIVKLPNAGCENQDSGGEGEDMFDVTKALQDARDADFDASVSEAE
ncbi:hypothetical protein M413DRAFT_23558 [Hebeloma cylindrosporum]|uniref:Protein ZIP4 homolog n=1 Tax=Hebeloma cylindrosporum TaxID=76867 RepID=A0A0C2Z287_HEBCY|nr:hypothetical protein M413DRAFT_23558 [Hebeloma cylindrosporum h7]